MGCLFSCKKKEKVESKSKEELKNLVTAGSIITNLSLKLVNNLSLVLKSQTTSGTTRIALADVIVPTNNIRHQLYSNFVQTELHGALCKLVYTGNRDKSNHNEALLYYTDREGTEKFFQEELVKRGLVYAKELEIQEESKGILSAAQEKAKTEKLGMWSTLL